MGCFSYLNKLLPKKVLKRINRKKKQHLKETQILEWGSTFSVSSLDDDDDVDVAPTQPKIVMVMLPPSPLLPIPPRRNGSPLSYNSRRLKPRGPPPPVPVQSTVLTSEEEKMAKVEYFTSKKKVNRVKRQASTVKRPTSSPPPPPSPKVAM